MKFPKLQITTCILIGAIWAGIASTTFADAFRSERANTIVSASANDEATLLLKVKAALVADPALRGQSIEVGALGPIITLYGTVDTSERRDKAVQVASRVEGVKSVRSNLLVINK